MKFPFLILILTKISLKNIKIPFKNKSQTKHSFATFVLEISERTLSSLVPSIKLVLNNQTSCITCIITIDKRHDNVLIIFHDTLYYKQSNMEQLTVI